MAGPAKWRRPGVCSPPASSVALTHAHTRAGSLRCVHKSQQQPRSASTCLSAPESFLNVKYARTHLIGSAIADVTGLAETNKKLAVGLALLGEFYQLLFVGKYVVFEFFKSSPSETVGFTEPNTKTHDLVSFYCLK